MSTPEKCAVKNPLTSNTIEKTDKLDKNLFLINAFIDKVIIVTSAKNPDTNGTILYPKI